MIRATLKNPHIGFNVFKKLFVLLIIIAMFSFFAFGSIASADINQQINYQGKLTNNAGVSVSDGTYNMEFKLYTVSSGGSPVWTETRTSGDKVQVTNGLFSVMLGEVTSITSVDFNQTLYLGVNIGGTTTPSWDGEMSPRKKLGAVPAAIQALYLGTASSTQYLRSDQPGTLSSSTASTLFTLNQLGGGKIFDIQSSGTSVFTILNDGKIGLGTTTPSANLVVRGTSGSASNVFMVATSSEGTLFKVAASGLAEINPQGQTGGLIVAPTLANSQAVISLYGRGGSAEQYTSAWLTSANGGLRLGGNSFVDITDGAGVGAGNYIVRFLGSDHSLMQYNTSGVLENVLNPGGVSYLNGGNVGIGTTTPDTALSVVGTTTTSNLIVGSYGSSGFANSIASFIGSTTGYMQVVAQNKSASTSASTDFVATADNGNDTSYFVDLGINSSTYNDPAFTITGANDAYLYSQSTALAIGTATTSSSGVIKFHTGGTLAANERMRIDVNGNIGIGTTSPSEKLHVAGNILIGAKPDSAPVWTVRSSGTAGTIDTGDTASIASTTAMAVFNGSVYVGTTKANAAEVYRYDGGTNWTKVSNATAGTVASGGTANIDGISTMNIYNGQLYLGTKETGAAEVYRYDGNSVWTRISSSTAGAIGGNGTTTAINEVSAMTVFGGSLYIGTAKTNGAEVYRYNGTTTPSAASWTKVSNIPANAGTIGATANVDRVSAMATLNGYLYIGTSETNAGGIYRYDGQGTSGTGFTILGTAGTYSGTNSLGIASTITAVDNVTTLAVYNGRLYAGINDGAGTARVVKWDGVPPSTGTNWQAISSSTAGIIAEDVGAQTGIDQIGAMSVYNDDLFVGTVDSTGIAEVYKVDVGSTWSRVSSSTAGALGGVTSSITGVHSMTVYNDELWVGSAKATAAEVYSYGGAEAESYALQFAANSDEADGIQNGFANKAWIEFQAEETAFNNTGNQGTGKFVFSHGVNTMTGAYDLAEDYPTRDDALAATDLVSLDTTEKGFVRKSVGKNDRDIIGIYSENPALRLSQKDAHIDGARAVPIALAGRVPVKVSLENGPIKIGDYITAGSAPGVAAKAVKPGRVVGRALSSYSGAEGEDSRVTVFIGVETINWSDITDAAKTVSELTDITKPETQDTMTQLIDAARMSVADIAVAVINEADNVSITITNKLVSLVANIKQLFVDTLTILPGGNLFLPSGENQIAGSGVMPAGQTEIFISNSQIDSHSSIYLTLTSVTEVPLYVAEKKTGQGFVVRVAKPFTEDISFDWFFVKVYNSKNKTEQIVVDNAATTTTTTTTVLVDVMEAPIVESSAVSDSASSSVILETITPATPADTALSVEVSIVEVVDVDSSGNTEIVPTTESAAEVVTPPQEVIPTVSPAPTESAE